ncbi:hypothetical protein SNOG_12520 [Parastagonospora nodorum SN15]|uniref:Uncharacterized protein n=1 Tax=Phaeosphaeria nodorum (strain SN15 / ATCC MYA-4574 / FGSC 10173) TaxID=321614 RepID=Q0U6U4_PHANO|nr:hypothetical protein SNOG_12520 [Parastagonospora nodorum SN15]EAT80333.1 hypothetical protein SNOG_12520 [Parastagonospora nodorum SN15]
MYAQPTRYPSIALSPQSSETVCKQAPTDPNGRPEGEQ